MQNQPQTSSRSMNNDTNQQQPHQTTEQQESSQPKQSQENSFEWPKSYGKQRVGSTSHIGYRPENADDNSFNNYQRPHLPSFGMPADVTGETAPTSFQLPIPAFQAQQQQQQQMISGGGPPPHPSVHQHAAQQQVAHQLISAARGAQHLQQTQHHQSPQHQQQNLNTNSYQHAAQFTTQQQQHQSQQQTQIQQRHHQSQQQHVSYTTNPQNQQTYQTSISSGGSSPYQQPQSPGLLQHQQHQPQYAQQIQSFTEQQLYSNYQLHQQHQIQPHPSHQHPQHSHQQQQQTALAQQMPIYTTLYKGHQKQLPPQVPQQQHHQPQQQVQYNMSGSSPQQPRHAVASQQQHNNSNAHCRGFDTRQISMSQSIMFLDLFTFKIDQCQLDPQNHNLKRCPFYHDSFKDRRRPLGTYQSEICPNMIGKNQNCPKQDHCERAHNRVEEFYHPDKYKAKFCSSYLEVGGPPCEYQEYCSFAHNQSELSIELIEKYEIDMDFYMFHFKTVWCPYREDDHDRKICVYAHNWQDFRRRPSTFLYSCKMCPNWQVNNFISSYSEGCQNQYQCLYSHGWKEQEYHPDFLKVKQCQHGVNCKKSHCPYYHSEHDRQVPLAKGFSYFPKTRVSAFNSNFYLGSYGTTQNYMANKQTSFSSLPTQILCNNGRLNQGRRFSPDSNFSTSSQTNISQQHQQQQQRGGAHQRNNTHRSNASSQGSQQLSVTGNQSQNSTRKGNKKSKNAHSRQSQNSSNSAYQLQQQQQQQISQQQQQQHQQQLQAQQHSQLQSTNSARNQQNLSQQHQQQQQFNAPQNFSADLFQAVPGQGHSQSQSQQQMQQHHKGPTNNKQMQQYQKQQSDTQVTFIKPASIVSNHFGQISHPISMEENSKEFLAVQQPNDLRHFPYSPVTQNNMMTGTMPHASLTMQQMVDSPLKHSGPNVSSQSISLSNNLSQSGSASANNSASSAQLGISPHYNHHFQQPPSIQRGNSFVHPQSQTGLTPPDHDQQYNYSGQDQQQVPQPVQCDDPYSLGHQRTISYGVDYDRHNNSLFVSAKFGGSLLEQSDKRGHVVGTAGATHGGGGSTLDHAKQQANGCLNLGGVAQATYPLSENQSKQVVHRSASCQSFPSQYQTSQTNQLLAGAGGYAVPGGAGGASGAGGCVGGEGQQTTRLSVHSHNSSAGAQKSYSSNTTEKLSKTSQPQQIMPLEESKQQLADCIEEEGSSGSSSDQEKTNKMTANDDSANGQKVDGGSGHKKKSLLTKMRRGLSKLKITKTSTLTSSEEKNQERDVSGELQNATGVVSLQKNDEQMMIMGVRTYEKQAHPKSATLRKGSLNDQSSGVTTRRRTSALLSSLQEREPLHAIEEEAQQREGSQSQLQVGKSHSEHGGVRPGTPEFNFEGEPASGDDENDQEQKDQIRARMEAQIQGFDDDN